MRARRGPQLSSDGCRAPKKISRSLARYGRRERKDRGARPVRARREHREVDEGTEHSREKRNRAGCRGVAM